MTCTKCGQPIGRIALMLELRDGTKVGPFCLTCHEAATRGNAL